MDGAPEPLALRAAVWTIAFVFVFLVNWGALLAATSLVRGP